MQAPRHQGYQTGSVLAATYWRWQEIAAHKFTITVTFCFIFLSLVFLLRWVGGWRVVVVVGVDG